MGRISDNPRYNVISFRMSDAELKRFKLLQGRNSANETARNIILEVMRYKGVVDAEI